MRKTLLSIFRSALAVVALASMLSGCYSYSGNLYRGGWGGGGIGVVRGGGWGPGMGNGWGHGWGGGGGWGRGGVVAYRGGRW